MSNPNLPAHRRFAGLMRNPDRRTANAVAEIHEAMFFERAHDAAERDLATLRVSDIAHVGRHGIAEAADVVDLASSKVAANPVCANAVAEITQTTVQGIERELRRLTREG
jgi:hypothetical protein